MDIPPHDLPRILDGLNAIGIGTRDRDLLPACGLAAGIHADGEGHLTVFMPEETGQRIFANVEANGAVAVVLEHIPTHRTVQVKGVCVEMRPAREDERPIVERSQGDFFRDVESIGAPAQVRRRNRWPCRAITLRVTDVFEQTPGPRAGLRFGTASP